MDKQQKENKQSMTKKPSRFGHFLIFFLIIILFAGIGSFTWQNYQLQKQNSQQIKNLQNAIQNIQQNINQQNENITNVQQTMQNFIATSSRSAKDWVVPEIEYLINSADINLRFNHNIPATIKLLQAADKRAEKLSDPALIDLRTALANDINALSAAPKVDTYGIALQIDAFSNQIMQVPVTPNALPQQSTRLKTQNLNTDKTFWEKLSKQSLQKLQHILIIKHHSQKIEPLLPEEQIYLKENIRLLLEQAKIGVLHRNIKIYAFSLKRAQQLITVCFENNLSAVQNVLDALQNLQKINVNPPMPNISASIRAAQKAAREISISEGTAS